MTEADIQISERAFESQVKHLAEMLGWLYYHTWRSIHSPAGYPDCIMTRDGRLVIAELKKEDGQPTPEQYFWLLELSKVPFLGVFLWRPSDLEGEVVEILR